MYNVHCVLVRNSSGKRVRAFRSRGFNRNALVSKIIIRFLRRIFFFYHYRRTTQIIRLVTCTYIRVVNIYPFVEEYVFNFYKRDNPFPFRAISIHIPYSVCCIYVQWILVKYVYKHIVAGGPMPT